MQEKLQATPALFKTGNFQRCFQQWQSCWTLKSAKGLLRRVNIQKKIQPTLLFIASHTSQDRVQKTLRV